MKFNKIISVALVALSSSLFQSCLKDQEDIFDEPTSLRVQAVLDDTKKTLMDAPNGWVFEYYPDRNISYGGYVYTVKFDEKEVTVGCELAPGEFESSLYKLTGDNGPTLSFDTYNSIMHFFATPWGGGGFGYQAYDGDFEFAIVEATPELVTLRGKRTGNIMYMRPLEGEAEQSIEAVAGISDNMFLTSAEGNVGTADVTVEIDLDTRYMEFSWGENSVGNYFVPTATGIRFLEPIFVGDGEINTLDYDPENMSYTGITSGGTSFTLIGSIPPTYSKFEEFIGNFTINFNKKYSVNVTLEPDKANNRFIVKGINKNYDVIATYKKAAGVIEICSQQVATDGNQLIWFCMWGLNPSTGSGSITWDTTAGMQFVKDPDKEGTFNIVSNGYEGLSWPPNTFCAYYFTGSVGATPRGQAVSKWRPLCTDNYYRQMTYLETMVKRN